MAELFCLALEHFRLHTTQQLQSTTPLAMPGVRALTCGTAVQPTQSLPLMQRDPRLVDDYPERLSMTHRVMSQPDLSQQGTTLPRKKSWLARTFSRKKKSIASAGSVASGSPAGAAPCTSQPPNAEQPLPSDRSLQSHCGQADSMRYRPECGPRVANGKYHWLGLRRAHKHVLWVAA